MEGRNHSRICFLVVRMTDGVVGPAFYTTTKGQQMLKTTRLMRKTDSMKFKVGSKIQLSENQSQTNFWFSEQA